MARIGGGGGGAVRLSGRFDTVVFATCVILALVASALPAPMREPVSSALRRTLVAPLVGLQRGAERWRAAWLESERKTLQNDSLALEFVHLQALRVENDRLRKLLGLGSGLKWGFIPAEALHTSGRAEDVVTSLTLTAGAKSGVTQYSPVVSAEGIVGLVQTVDPRMATAILYSHPDFRVSAMSADGSAFGIVYPHLEGRARRLAERYLLELRNVPFRDTLRLGTAIFSSGLGGAWPRGILIGNVMEDITDSTGWSRTYIVRPAVNPAHLTSVMILTPQRASQGVGNIWVDAAQVQAALRGIVAAGDSVTRLAALAEAAARRAALDSIRRGLIDSTGRLGAPAPVAPVAPPDPVADSARAAARRARALLRDSIRRDSLRRDSIRRDSIARDTLTAERP
jgi:rod shape-determining protein MreC